MTPRIKGFRQIRIPSGSRTVLPLAALAAVFAATLPTGALVAREWMSVDGRTLEADYVSATEHEVTLKRASDGREFTLPLDRLSEADREWVAEKRAEMPEPSAVKAIDGEYASLVTGDWALSEFKDLPFAFFGGKDLDAAQRYPLVVALHGKSENNENGRQVGGWMKTFASEARYGKNPCFILAPLCYQPFGGTGGGWSDKPGTETVALVKDLIKNLPIDPKRVYLIGYSMGGFGTCRLMADEPRLFAAGVPVAGYGSSGEAGPLRRLPLWLFHAADDEVVSVDGARRFAEALERSKVFKYTEFPDGGHGIIGRVFDDDAVHEWLFQQSDS